MSEEARRTLRYVEPLNDARTMLADFFSILLDRFVLEQQEKHGITALPLEERAVFHLHKLPALHRDPFDRMLICQAIEHDCVLLTPDPLIAQYPVRTQW